MQSNPYPQKFAHRYRRTNNYTTGIVSGPVYSKRKRGSTNGGQRGHTKHCMYNQIIAI